MKKKITRILLIEDNPDDARLVRESLAEAGAAQFDLAVAADLASALAHLVNQPVDAILLDLSLPDSTGFGTFRKVHEQAPQAPIILLTGRQDEEQAANAVRKGAQDYLLKSQANGEVLVRSIRYAIQREQAETALRENEARYRNIFEGVQDAILVETPAGQILDINRRACEMYGYTREQFLTRTVNDLVPSKDYIVAFDPKHPSTFPLRPVETVNMRANGEQFPIEISIHARKLSGEIVLFVVARDITERKRAEEALIRAEQKYRSIFENAMEGIHQTTSDGKIISINPAGARMLGYDSPDELMIDFNLVNNRLYVQPGRREEFQRLMETHGAVSGFESEVYRKDGSTAWISENAHSVCDEHGNLLYYEGSSVDITKRKQAEAELQASREAESNFSELLTILSETTTELSKAENLDTLCRRAVELGRERFDFDRLSIFFLSDDSTAILGTFGVDAEGRITDERGNRYPVNPASNIWPILQSQVPLFRLTDTPLSLKGQVVGQGMHVIAGLWDGNTAIGYITVDNLLRQRPFGDHDCEIIRLYASALGHLISLKRAEMELQASHAAEKVFSERLAALSEVTTELSKEGGLDELCRRVVELGRERLDFDRLSVWFITDDHTTMLGTYGVDNEGRISDERDESFLIKPDFPIHSLVQGRFPLVRLTDTPLYHKGQAIGHGAHVFAGLWDGKSFIGYISVDNQLRQRPFDDRDCEIIRLYAYAVGQLISVQRAQTTLKTTERIYRQAITRAGGVPYQVDYANDRYVFLGEGIENLTGYIPAEMTRSSFFTSRLRQVESYGEHKDLPHDERVRLARQEDAIKDWREDYLFERKDGTLIWLSDHSVPVVDTAGNLVGSLGILMDITERKQAEEVLRLRLEQLVALNRASQTVATSLDLEQVLKQVMSLASNVANSEHTSVVLLDKAGQISRGVENMPDMRSIEQRARPRGLTRWIMRTRRPAVVDEIDAKGVIRPSLGEGAPRTANPDLVAKGIKSFVGLPLIVEDHSVGVLYLHSTRPGTFHDQLILLTAFANQAAIAIQKARLYDSIQDELAERKQAEQALRESEERYHGLFLTSLEGIGLSKGNQVLEANPALLDIFGYEDKEEFLNKPLLEHVAPESRAMIEALQVKRAQGKPVDQRHEYMILRKNGEKRNLEISITSVKIKNEIFTLSTFRDITERKSMEEKLGEERTLLRTLIDNLPDRIYVMDAQGRKIISNIADWQASGGKTMDDVIGKTDLEMYPPELAQDFWSLDKKVIDSGISILNREEPGLDSQGNQVRVLSSKVPLRDGQGKIVGLVGIGRDITEFKRAQELLQESEERYKLMFESAPLAINITRGTEITYANPGYLKMFGYSSLDDLKNVAPLELFVPESRPQILENIQRRAKGLPVPEFYEVDCIRKDGARFPIQMYLTRTTFADGPATVGFILDISERRKAEIAVRQQMDELQRWYGLTLDRETRTLELKQEVNALLQRLNEPERYSAVEK